MTLKSTFSSFLRIFVWMWKSRWRHYFTKQGLRHLLINTDFTMGQIAQMIGYTTSSRFAELFKKKYGHSADRVSEDCTEGAVTKYFFREETRL